MKFTKHFLIMTTVAFQLPDLAQAENTASFRLSGYMPVICNVSLDVSGTVGLINQDCNTDHKVVITYDPGLLPMDQIVTISYAGQSVTLDESGRRTVTQSGPIREKRTLSIQNQNQIGLENLISSFKVEYELL
ncbi:MAG: hypothetical protein ACLFRA_03985 [Alphaproteobacteria bacterium]